MRKLAHIFSIIHRLQQMAELGDLEKEANEWLDIEIIGKGLSDESVRAVIVATGNDEAPPKSVGRYIWYIDNGIPVVLTDYTRFGTPNGLKWLRKAGFFEALGEPDEKRSSPNARAE